MAVTENVDNDAKVVTVTPVSWQQAAAAIDHLTLFCDMRKSGLFMAFMGLAALLEKGGPPSEILKYWSCLVMLAAPSWKEAVQNIAAADENQYTRLCSCMSSVLQQKEAFSPAVLNMAAAECAKLGMGEGVDSITRTIKLALSDTAKIYDISNMDTVGLAFEVRKAVPQWERERVVDEAALIHYRGGGFIVGSDGVAKTESGAFTFTMKGREIVDLSTYVHRRGVGVFQNHWAFIWKKDGVHPVVNIDRVTMDDLIGYEQERAMLWEEMTTFALGDSNNNVLLYGDRGTGKSATIKAAARKCEECGFGMRIIEVGPKYYSAIPEIFKKVRYMGGQYLLFLDDLCFESEYDSRFSALKRILEGGLESQPDNVAIYATTNRRHLLAEKHSERPSSQDDVRGFDTMQSQLSLADRFSLCILFSAPSQEEYFKIVLEMADDAGILPRTDEEAKAEFDEKDATVESRKKDFCKDAERWAQWCNGRSPRTARQFIDHIVSGNDFPWEEAWAPPRRSKRQKEEEALAAAKQAAEEAAKTAEGAGAADGKQSS